jgi:hypothetical protein
LEELFKMYKIKQSYGKWENTANKELIHEECPNTKCDYKGTLFYPLDMRQPTCNKCNGALKGGLIKISVGVRIDYFLGLRGYDKYSHSV